MSRNPPARDRCSGCGAILDDAAAFQEHCMTVEHDDDFTYECEQVKIVRMCHALAPSRMHLPAYVHLTSRCTSPSRSRSSCVLESSSRRALWTSTPPMSSPSTMRR